MASYVRREMYVYVVCKKYIMYGPYQEDYQ